MGKHGAQEPNHPAPLALPLSQSPFYSALLNSLLFQKYAIQFHDSVPLDMLFPLTGIIACLSTCFSCPPSRARMSPLKSLSLLTGLELPQCVCVSLQYP